MSHVLYAVKGCARLFCLVSSIFPSLDDPSGCVCMFLKRAALGHVSRCTVTIIDISVPPTCLPSNHACNKALLDRICLIDISLDTTASNVFFPVLIDSIPHQMLFCFESIIDLFVCLVQVLIQSPAETTMLFLGLFQYESPATVQ